MTFLKVHFPSFPFPFGGHFARVTQRCGGCNWIEESVTQGKSGGSGCAFTCLVPINESDESTEI